MTTRPCPVISHYAVVVVVALRIIITATTTTTTVVAAATTTNTNNKNNKNNNNAIQWIPQRLGNPYQGQYTGITAADLNGDGRPDLLVSAGKHWIDQSYVLMNLGPRPPVPAYYGVQVSSPLPLGDPGAHYAVQVGRWASFSTSRHEWGVLLAGADCSTAQPNPLGSCIPGTVSPAVLLRVSVQGCDKGNNDCTLEWSVEWQDGAPAGDRNAALAYNLGNSNNGKDMDPAIVLVGNGGAAIYEPPYSNSEPTLRISPDQKLPYQADAIVRGAGLAVGDIGLGFTGFFVGTRSMAAVPPAPVVGVWKTDTSYAWYTLGNDNNAYAGSSSSSSSSSSSTEQNTNVPRVDVQSTGLVLADLNGDGILDLIEANHLDGPQRVDGYPIQQDYYLLDDQGFGSPTSFAWEMGGGRAVDAGPLFSGSDDDSSSNLPDIVLGTSDGYIVWFANLGHDERGNFQGLQERHRRLTVQGCEVRSVKIVPNLVRPCAPSVVAAVYCFDDASLGGVFAFHDATTMCPSSQLGGNDDAPPLPLLQEETLTPTKSPSNHRDGKEQDESPIDFDRVVGANTVDASTAAMTVPFYLSFVLLSGTCIWFVSC